MLEHTMFDHLAMLYFWDRPSRSHAFDRVCVRTNAVDRVRTHANASVRTLLYAEYAWIVVLGKDALMMSVAQPEIFALSVQIRWGKVFHRDLRSKPQQSGLPIWPISELSLLVGLEKISQATLVEAEGTDLRTSLASYFPGCGWSGVKYGI